MKKKDTKQTIINAAVIRFNEKGFGKVSMKEIAEEVGLSRGNLAYHFKKKDALLEMIAEQMWTAFESKREEALSFPSFKNLIDEAHAIYQLQKHYSFIFLDSQVLNHPLIQSKVRKMCAKYIRDRKEVIAYSIKMGNIKPEEIPGTYQQVILTNWMITFYWLSQQVIRGEVTQEMADKTLWCLIIPHLTEKGKKSLTKFLGEEMMANMGEPFEFNIEHLVTI